MNSPNATDLVVTPTLARDVAGVDVSGAATAGIRGMRASSSRELSAGQRRSGRWETEGRFVFALAGDEAEYATQLDPVPDWTRLLQVAWDAGAAGALRDYMRKHRQGTVPVAVERTLACLALERDLRMRTLQRRASDSIAVLRSAGIEVALLKGAALATTLYGSFASRPMNDVDLLVHSDQADEAKRLMLLAGWERDPELPDDVVYASHHHLAPLIDARGSRSRLEIHRTLLPAGHPFALPMSELWAGMRAANLAGNQVVVLAPIHHALHIAIHFAWSHTMREGAWNAFRDLGAMERAGMIDWDELVRVATRARAASCCYWTLALARALAKVHVPDDVLAALQPDASGALLGRLERHFAWAILRRDGTQLSVRLDRALWSSAIQPREHGHGDVRPWLVSAELTPARIRHETISRTGRAIRHAGRIARSGACIARLLWN